MKTKNVLLIVGAALALAAALYSCSNSDAKNEADKMASRSESAVSVRVQELRPAPFVDVLNVVGIIKAYDDVLLSPEEGGVVKEWKVERGQHVAKGEVLVVLKDEVARASYDAALAQYKMAQMNFEKQERVYSEQGISEMQFKNMEYNRDAAKAQADLMKARLEQMILRSPVDGILTEQLFDEGEFAPRALPIAHVVNVRRLKISAEVSERHAGDIALGTPVTLTFDAFPGDTTYGKISYVGAMVSSSNRTLPVEVVIPNPKMHIKPEMVAKVKLLRATKADALLVSEDIVQLVDRGRTIVYVENGGKAEERRLRLGGRQGNMVEVLEGLNSGDRIIVTGYQKLVNGTPVVVAQQPER
jgi:membrane fusion protein (multidrug efflux system)